MFTKASFLLLLCLFTSCTSTPKATPDYQACFALYERQDYDACLATISSILSENKNPHLKTDFMLLKAECLEASNKLNEADAIYADITKKYPGTAIGNRALTRLAREASDEREHFSIRFAPGKWKRVQKRWNASELRERYIPADQVEGQSREALVIYTKDFTAGRPSLDEALVQMRADMQLNAQHVVFQTLETKDNNALFEFKVSSPPKVEREKDLHETQYTVLKKGVAGVGRLLITRRRVHLLCYINSYAPLDSRKQLWLTSLKNAALIDYKTLEDRPQ
jgi:hypothetical protein